MNTERARQAIREAAGRILDQVLCYEDDSFHDLQCEIEGELHYKASGIDANELLNECLADSGAENEEAWGRMEADASHLMDLAYLEAMEQHAASIRESIEANLATGYYRPIEQMEEG